VPVAIVTGSAGLVGSESVEYLIGKGFRVFGIDNDMRSYFFGPDSSTRWNRDRLLERYGSDYVHREADIRDRGALESVFRELAPEIDLIVHAAAQPSHDWAAREPTTDFAINAVGTHNLLEMLRVHAPDAVFVFTSTNKVYGDAPNRLPFVELETRWDVDPSHPMARGIDESMSIDQSLHSLFGASKVAADVLVQEYGRYFRLKTACFRAGCLTGPMHSGAQLHGFLAYLMRCTLRGDPYTVFGYKGKQVRDNLHSYDLVNAFHHFYLAPRCGQVYNIGGSRHSECSMIEAIRLCEEITGKRLRFAYTEASRTGDHIWYVSDVNKFQNHHPNWRYRHDLRSILEEIYTAQVGRGP
jgi:CDP-paratose 2-epimerase